MKKRRRLLAFLMASALVLSTAACGAEEPAGGKEIGTDPDAAPVNEGSTSGDASKADNAKKGGSSGDTPLVIATEDFSEKFCDFFTVSAADATVIQLTSLALLGNDRAGEIVYNGIEGETREYNGTEYTYNGLSDCKVTENADGTVDYEFKLREGVKFSDGEEVTADDVIFSYYVVLDPSYDGTISTSALPIVGLEEYRNGSDILYNLLLKAGADNKDFTFITEDQQKKFFDKDLPEAGVKFAQSIADYCTANGIAVSTEAVAKADIANAMANWGFAKDNEDGTIMTAATGTTFDVAGGKAPTAEDFWNEMMVAYDGDILALSGTEKADKEILDFLPDDYRIAIETGESADNVEGIKKIDDYTVRVTLSEVDATAIYQLSLTVSPMHYYGDPAKYDYENNKFGFDKGDLSMIRSKTSSPMGAGPYKFEKYENKVVYLSANENFIDGPPAIKNIQLKTTSMPDLEAGVVQGTIDISSPQASKSSLEQIRGENSNGELSGDVLTTVLTDYRGYGYIGMNSQNVCVNGENGSEASKNLRKAIATVISVYRDVVIDSYYGEAASVINYPISNTSWAAPQPSDPDYRAAFSVDVDGNDIYSPQMTEDEKYDAALNAALGFFEAAGYTVKDGKLTAAPKGAKMGYEVMITGAGSGDHPSFGILTAASEALKTIGFDLSINDLTDSSILWSALDAGTADMWCAAWQTTLDPDMFQIYHSEGGSAGRYRIYSPELDKMIVEAKEETNQSVRKAMYKEALEFVVDFACEIPVYQRQDCTIFSTERIDIDTLCKDQTTYYNFFSEINTLAMK